MCVSYKNWYARTPIYIYILGVIGCSRDKGSDRRNDSTRAQRRVSFMERACERTSERANERSNEQAEQRKSSPNRARNRSQIDPKSPPNRPQIEPKSSPRRFGPIRNDLGRSGDVRGTLRDALGTLRERPRTLQGCSQDPSSAFGALVSARRFEAIFLRRA